MTRVIAVANQKGGVGKTTTVANLGAALSVSGYRVLLIDLDPQAALTATFGIDPYNLPRSMYSVLLKETSSIARVLRPAGRGGNMAIAPSSVDLAAAEVQLVKAERRAHRLQSALDQNKIPFDFILVDTPPSLGLLTLNALVAAKEVFIPVQCHFLAMRGVRALMESIWRVKRRLNPDLRLLGLLPTMYTPETRHSKQVVKELKTVFGSKVFDITINTSVEFAEAPVSQQALVDYRPNHEGSMAYIQLAEVIANNV